MPSSTRKVLNALSFNSKPLIFTLQLLKSLPLNISIHSSLSGSFTAVFAGAACTELATAHSNIAASRCCLNPWIVINSSLSAVMDIVINMLINTESRNLNQLSDKWQEIYKTKLTTETSYTNPTRKPATQARHRHRADRNWAVLQCRSQRF